MYLMANELHSFADNIEICESQNLGNFRDFPGMFRD